MRRKIFLPILALGMLCFAIFHVVRAQQTPTKLPPPNDPARNPYLRTIAGSGVVEPRSENIALGSPLPGVVAEVMVKVGDPVYGPTAKTLATPLFRLDDRQLQAEWRVRQSNVTAAKATLIKLQKMPRPEEVPPVEARVKEAKALLEDARDQYQRAKDLIRTKAIGEEELVHKRLAVITTEAQLSRSEADLKLLQKGAWEYEIAIAEAAVQQFEALLRQTETELERLIVRAPVSGTVLQRNVRPGEYVGIPPGQALILLGDISELYVRMDVDESDITRFRPGLPGKATPRGNAAQEVQLKFVRVEPFVIPKKALTGAGTERVDTRVLQVMYAIESTNANLYVGQQMDVFLDVSGEK